jgi:hypothetical protein
VMPKSKQNSKRFHFISISFQRLNLIFGDERRKICRRSSGRQRRPSWSGSSSSAR